MKLDLQLDAFSLVGIDAWTPGEGDLALGIDAVRDTVAAHDIPAVAGNLVCDGKAPFPAARTVTRGGVTVGFIGVIDPTLLGDGLSGCTATDPVLAVRTAVSEHPGVVHWVLLHHGDEADDAALAREVPAIGLVVNGHARISRPEARPLPAGAVGLAAASRGKSVGIADVTFVPGAQPGVYSGGDDGARTASQLERYRKRLQTADKALEQAADDEARTRAQRQVDFYGERVKALEEEQAAAEASALGTGVGHQVGLAHVQLGKDIDEHAPTMAKVEAALERISALEAAHEAPATRPGLAYVGTDACLGCHADQHAQWTATPHARAWNSLVAEHRERDRACFQCHSTGAFDPAGPTHPMLVTGSLQGVGCESCHGAGKTHVATQAAADIVRDPPQATCVQCHDGEQDEGRFDWDAYRPKVVHGASGD